MRFLQYFILTLFLAVSAAVRAELPTVKVSQLPVLTISGSTMILGVEGGVTGRTTPAAIIASGSLVYQPLDADLSSIAALSTSSFGRSLLTQADAAAARTTLGLAIGTNVQAWDADLDSIASLVTAAFGRSLLTQADAAAARATLGLVIGTNVQAFDSDLSVLATGSLPNVTSGTWTGGRTINLTLTGTSIVTGLLDAATIDVDVLKIQSLPIANQPQWTSGLEQAMQNLGNTIRSGRSIGFKVVGDSLGSGSDEWVKLFTNSLATSATNHIITYKLITPNADPAIRVWSSTTVQAASGEAYWQFSATASGSFGVTFTALDAPPPTGNCDIETKFRVDNWEAQDGRDLWAWDGSTSPDLTTVSKLRLNDNRRMQFIWYDGTGTFRSALTGNLGTVAGNVVATAPTDGTDWWVRVRANFRYTGTTSQIVFAKSSDGSSWTTMQTVEVSGTGIWNPASKPVMTLGGVPGFPMTSSRIYKHRVRDGFDGPTTNLLPIDHASMGSNGNTVQLMGSPEIIVENWSYPGTTTNDLIKEIFGIQQQEVATASGTISGSGDATIIVTGSTATLGSFSSTLSVAVTSGDTAAVWGGKVRTALQGNSTINSIYEPTGYSTAILLTKRLPATANDSSLNISLDNGTCTGITTAATSANTTAGRATKIGMFGNNGDFAVFYSAGMNDSYTGPYTVGRQWQEGVTMLMDGLTTRAPLAHPILLATNPRVSTAGNVQSQQFIDMHGQRSGQLAKLAAYKNWGFVNIWGVFMSAGANTSTYIPDGVHPSSTGVNLYWAPYLPRSYDAVKP